MTSGPGESSSSSRPHATYTHLPALHTSAPPPPQQTQHGALLLTVRFSNSLPDLLLDIQNPATTTIAALKHLIRLRLAQPTSQRRLRFIHGGRILPDTAIVAAVLKPVPPPPRDIHQQQNASPGPQDPKGKGKAVHSRDAQRVYVNCSIGDQLTSAELEEERRKAEEPVPEDVAGAANTSLPGGYGAEGARTTTTRGPRGFDRLLAAGFSPAEVNQLRLQHRSIQESRHTADTLPSPDTLRSMEDAWLDNNNDAGGGGGMMAASVAGANDEAAAAGLGDEFGLAGILDLLLKGMFIGFVWPLGAIGWLVRDEEKIPKRMRVFVYFGFFLSLLIGTIRVIG